jgi:hypothetical protein
MKNVTIDFDGTLQKQDVQDFVRMLMRRPDVTVYILTARFDELHKAKWQANPSNSDLYRVTDALGIPRERIRFQCFISKWEYLMGANVVVHLDDDREEIQTINDNTAVVCVDVKKLGWQERMLNEVNKPLRIQLPTIPHEILL